ncbi:MAG: 23S rRNA (uracil(1939)-C(5))-methyltransferase RlmD [Pseudomonadales bacterium]
MKEQDPIELHIDELHPDGYSLSTQHGMAVFGALPGETVIAKPFTRRRKRIFARTLSVTVSAPERVKPACSAADNCGGCSFQHFDPESQIEFKQAYVIGLCSANKPAEVMAPLCGAVKGYRTKARLGVKYVSKKARVLVGFREKMSPFVAEIDRCEVLKEPVGELLPELGKLIGELSCPSAIPQIEVAVGDEEVALVLRHLQPLLMEDIRKLKEFANLRGLSFYLQPDKPESAWKICPPDGPDRLYYTLPSVGLKFGFHPLDFVQVNADMNCKLVAKAMELLELEANDRVVDAFCGIGNFSLAIAQHAAHVLGLEVSASGIDRAQENARLNGVENCVFEHADLLADDLDIFMLGDANKLLLDPPRTGAESLVKKLASSKVERVVYVSCNPHTLARDTQVLVENGYQFEKAGVLDMFPHTTHIESIAVFSRQTS